MPSSGVATACQGKETDKIYIYGYKTKTNFTVFWYDHDNPGKSPKWCFSTDSATTQTVTLQNDDSTFNLDILNASAMDTANTEAQLKLVLGRGEQQYINITANTTANGFEYGVGTKDGDSQSGDIRVVGSMGGGHKDIGTWEENTLTVDGIKIYDPDEMLDSNKFKFGIPTDENTDFRANVQIYGEGATVTTTGTQFTKAPQGVLVVDTEVATVKGKNIIAIGGSAVNKVSAELLGLTYPTYGGDQAWKDATGVTGEGQAIIKTLTSPYSTDKVAMLVAGYSCLLYTSPSPRDLSTSRMPSSA